MTFSTRQFNQFVDQLAPLAREIEKLSKTSADSLTTHAETPSTITEVTDVLTNMLIGNSTFLKKALTADEFHSSGMAQEPQELAMKEAQALIEQINRATTNPETNKSILKGGPLRLREVLDSKNITKVLIQRLTDTTTPLEDGLDLSGLSLTAKDFPSYKTTVIPNATVDNLYLNLVEEGAPRQPVRFVNPKHTDLEATLTVEGLRPSSEEERFIKGGNLNKVEFFNEPVQARVAHPASLARDEFMTPEQYAKQLALYKKNQLSATSGLPIGLENPSIRQLTLKGATAKVIQENNDAGESALIRKAILHRGSRLDVESNSRRSLPLIEKLTDVAMDENTPTTVKASGTDAIGELITGKNTKLITENQLGQNTIKTLTVPAHSDAHVQSYGIEREFPTIGSTEVKGKFKGKGAFGDVNAEDARGVEIIAENQLGDVTIRRTPVSITAKGTKPDRLHGKDVPARPLETGSIRIENTATGSSTVPAPVQLTLAHIKTKGDLKIVGGDNHGVSITHSNVEGNNGIVVTDLSPNRNNPLSHHNTITIRENTVLAKEKEPSRIQVTRNDGDEEFSQTVDISKNKTTKVLWNGDGNKATIDQNGIGSTYTNLGNMDLEIGPLKNSHVDLTPSDILGAERVTVKGLKDGSVVNVKAHPDKETLNLNTQGRFDQFTVENSKSPDGRLTIENGSTKGPYIIDSQLQVKGDLGPESIIMENVTLNKGTDLTASTVTMIDSATPKTPLGSLRIAGHRDAMYRNDTDLVQLRANNVLIRGKNTQIDGGRIDGKDVHITLEEKASMNNMRLENDASDNITLLGPSSLPNARIVHTIGQPVEPLRYPVLSKDASLYGLRVEGRGVRGFFENIGYWWQDVTGKSNHHKNS